MHRIAANLHSRKPSFRCREFSETQFVALVILGNPICRANPIRSGLRLSTNARTTFRYSEFCEEHALEEHRQLLNLYQKRSSLLKKPLSEPSVAQNRSKT